MARGRCPLWQRNFRASSIPLGDGTSTKDARRTRTGVGQGAVGYRVCHGSLPCRASGRIQCPGVELRLITPARPGQYRPL